MPMAIVLIQQAPVMNASVVAANNRAKISCAIYWSCEDVQNWIEDLGYPQYRECFRINQINGRKLISVNGSTMPEMGINKYEHIVDITTNIKDLLEIKGSPGTYASLADPKIVYLDTIRRTGRKTDALSYRAFLRENTNLFR